MPLPRFGILILPNRWGMRMTDRDYELKLDELDRLLNDPDATMEPSKVWSLLAEISHRHLAEVAKPEPRPAP
jgi:hypothetical protein